LRLAPIGTHQLPPAFPLPPQRLCGDAVRDMPAYKMNGLKVAMMCEGSRGDCQPYVALALALKKQGCVIKFLTNAAHETMVKNVGLDYVKVGVSSEESLNKEKSLKDAMMDGNVFSFFAALAEVNNKNYPDSIKQGWTALEQFKPQLILYGVLCTAMVNAYTHMNTNVPAIPTFLAVTLPTGECPPLGLSAPPLAFVNKILWSVAMKSFFDGIKEQYVMAATHIGTDDFTKTLPMTSAEFVADQKSPITPYLIGVSPLVAPVPKDCEHPDITCTGSWVLDQKAQTERFLAGDVTFGGSQRAEIEAFLKAGAPPVYIGWGSMIAVSPEFMTKLAVSSLKEAGKRGVVLRGWAALAPELLVDQDLIEYAKANVLFITTAPHEWLMPQCAACVIHGGSGTTAASFRSGKPTIITPVWLDQHDFAKALKRLGNGIATDLYKNVTPKILGDAITKCLTDPEILKNAVDVSTKLKAEDGVGTAVQKIKVFVEGKMSNGEWLKDFDDRRKHNKHMNKSWWKSLMCMGDGDE